LFWLPPSLTVSHDDGRHQEPRQQPELCNSLGTRRLGQRRNRTDQRATRAAVPLYGGRRAGVFRRTVGAGLDGHQESRATSRRTFRRRHLVQQAADVADDPRGRSGHRPHQPHRQRGQRLLAGADLPFCGRHHWRRQWIRLHRLPGSDRPCVVRRSPPPLTVHSVEHRRRICRCRGLRLAVPVSTRNVPRSAPRADLARHRPIRVVGDTGDVCPGAGKEPRARQQSGSQKARRADRKTFRQFPKRLRAALVRPVSHCADSLSFHRARDTILLNPCRLVPASAA
jgi:hypothetical protein